MARARLRENLPAIAFAFAAILILAAMGLGDWFWNDYETEAQPAFDALVSGHLVHFLQLVPSYGGSLVMRAPFVLLPKLWGGGELSMYRAAAAPCLAASAILAVWLVARMRTLGRSVTARVGVLVLIVANPMTLTALQSGHPEDLLGGVLCVAAVLLALNDRPLWAGVMLGLAIANQEWAVVATGPVLIALRDRRPRALLAAGTTTAVILVPLLAAGRFASQVTGAASVGSSSIFTPWQLFWFLGPRRHVIPHGQPWNNRLDPAWLAHLAHPMIVAVALPLTLICLWLRRRRSRGSAGRDALLLLSLLLLLRFALDPWDNIYYALPFLIAIAAWEGLTAERPPVAAGLATLSAWFVYQWAVPSHGWSSDAQGLLFLVLVLPALAAISMTLFAPGSGALLARRLRRREPVLIAT